MVSEQFGLGAMAAFNPAQLELLQEMKELLNSMTKRLDRMRMGMNQQHETMIKKIDSVLAPVTRTDLVEDEEIEALLSDVGEVTERSKADLTSNDGFKVELTSSALVDEVVSENCVVGAAQNHQLGAVPNHGQIVDRISKILTERGAATSPSSASTKKKKTKKKKKKTTSFVKDRGKTSTLRSRGRRPRKINGKVRQKAYQGPSQVRSSASASASEKKTKAAATFVKDPRVPTSLSSASAKKKKRKKKKKEKETKFVKDRGKSTTGKRWRTQWHIDGGARWKEAERIPTTVRSSGKKTTKKATFVKDQGKSRLAVRGHGRRLLGGSLQPRLKNRRRGGEEIVVTARSDGAAVMEWTGAEKAATKNRGPRRGKRSGGEAGQGSGCEEAWSRRVAMRRGVTKGTSSMAVAVAQSSSCSVSLG